MRRADLNLPAEQLVGWVERLLFLLPASRRTYRRLGDETCGRWLPGTDDALGHRTFLKALWRRLSGGRTVGSDASELIQLFFVAIERLAGQMSNEAKVKLLEWLRDTDKLADLVQLVRQFGDRNRAIAFLSWLFHRQHGVDASERISFDALQRLVPGFSPPFDLDAIARFQAVCKSACARASNHERGKELFEKAAASETLGRFERLADLNEINTSGRKNREAGHRGWKFPGNNYSGGTFPIFDLVVRGPNNRMRLASCADGTLEYLLKKLRIVCSPDDRLFNRVVEELRFGARVDELADLAPLRRLSQKAARREVASRAVLLVHPDSVVPLRGVVASMEPAKLDKLLDEFMELRGLENRGKALEDLLASIQPGVDLD